MDRLMTQLYINWQKFQMFVCNVYGAIHFFYFLVKKGVFFKKDTSTSIEVLREFILSTTANYPANIVTGRTVGTSLNLFSVLVDKYLADKSSHVLEQLLYVYKEELLERGKNGRK